MCLIDLKGLTKLRREEKSKEKARKKIGKLGTKLKSQAEKRTKIG